MPVINAPRLNASEDLQPIPPGEYPARILGVKETTSSKGHPQLQWKLEIQTHDPAFHGRWISYWTGFAGRGLQDMANLVRSAGMADYDGGPFNSDDLIGKLITVVLERNYKDGVESPYPKVMEVRAFDDADLPF